MIYKVGVDFQNASVREGSQRLQSVERRIEVLYRPVRPTVEV